jgi:hypothetical protein
MTLKVYYQKHNDHFIDFGKGYEQNAARQIIRMMLPLWDTSEDTCTLIFNIEDPAMDLVVLTPRGLGIIDFKHINANVRGDENKPWHLILPDGSEHAIEHSEHYANPYQQLGLYRRRMYGILKARYRDYPDDLPEWMSDSDKFHYYIYAGLLFTGRRYNLELNIHSRNLLWFKPMWMDEFIRWTQDTMTFGNNLVLTAEQMDFIATTILNTSEWTDAVERQRVPHPYAQLSSPDGEAQTLHSLKRDHYLIGRSPDNDIQIADELTAVSRHHAVIRNTPEGAVVRDLESTNGTWVNGERIEREHPLHHRDLVVLGEYKDGQPTDISYAFQFRDTIPPAAETTITRAHRDE